MFCIFLDRSKSINIPVPSNGIVEFVPHPPLIELLPPALITLNCLSITGLVPIDLQMMGEPESLRTSRSLSALRKLTVE